MWPAIQALAQLVSQLIPLLAPKAKTEEDEDGTPSMRDVAIAQESGAVASRAGKDAARKAQRASNSQR